MRPRYATIISSCTFAGINLLLSVTACDDADRITARQPSLRSDEQPCEFLRAPRWVLRDKDGARVRALVEPRCGRAANASAGAGCLQLDFDTLDTYPCVRVIDHDGAYINLQFELQSGQLGPCQGGDFTDINTSWKQTGLALVAYANDKCEGDLFVWKGDYSYSEFTEAGTLYFADGDAWYVSEKGCINDSVKQWGWSTKSNSCISLLPVSSCPLRPVPAWVQNLLPNPPYTMAVEYE